MVLGYIARRVPVVGIVTTVLCAFFAARTISDLAEAGIIDEAAAAAPVPTAPPAPSAPTAARSGDGLVARNMFCSDCAPDTPPSRTELTGGVTATALPLLLIATSVGADPMATIRDTTTGAQGAYAVGDRLRGAGPIERISGMSVQFRNEALGRSERLDLLTAARDAGAAAAEPARQAPVANAAWGARIRAIDEHTFEVERSLVKELIASGTGAKVKGVRVAPLIKDGKLAGVRVSQALPDSMAAAVGLRTGDVIEAIDGIRLTSPDDMLTVMARLNSMTSARVQGRRGGQPLELEYRLR